MTREEVKAIFPDATEEQVSAFLDKNSKDIGKAKGDADKYKKEIESLKEQVKEKETTISELEKAGGDAKKVAEELEKYKQAEADRQAAEKAAKEKAAKTERFKTAKGEREFSSQFAESGVMNAFFEALSNPDNTGKGDAEIFDSLTKDIDGIFKNPQQQKINIPATGNTGIEPNRIDNFIGAARKAAGLKE